jgi:hypothetical protein
VSYNINLRIAASLSLPIKVLTSACNLKDQTNMQHMKRTKNRPKKVLLFADVKKKSFGRYIVFILLIMFCSVTTIAQSFLGTITKQVNFREGPGTDYNIVSSLKPGTQLFIVSLETENDYYDVIDIRTNKEGYVHKSFVKVGKQVKENDEGVFSSNGTTASYNPEIEVFNNTSLTLTLKLDDKTYSFNAHEKRTITTSPGAISYRASAPGVIPYIGIDHLESNEGYTWQFYIVTRNK